MTYPDDRRPSAPTSDETSGSGPGASRRRPAGRHRPHLRHGRARAVMVRLSEAEHADIAIAAQEAGLTPSGYAAETALAAARRGEPPARQPLRVAMGELIAARLDLTHLIHEPFPEDPSGVRTGSGDPASRAVVHAVTAVNDAATAVARALR